MKEKYALKSFSCKTCHPDNDNRKLRTKFAELIYQELKEKNYSQKWAETEPKGDEAIAEFEKLITKDFDKAIVIVGKKQITFDDLIKSGLFNGARIDEEKEAELESADKKADPENENNKDTAGDGK